VTGISQDGRYTETKRLLPPSPLAPPPPVASVLVLGICESISDTASPRPSSTTLRAPPARHAGRTWKRISVASLMMGSSPLWWIPMPRFSSGSTPSTAGSFRSSADSDSICAAAPRDARKRREKATLSKACDARKRREKATPSKARDARKRRQKATLSKTRDASVNDARKQPFQRHVTPENDRGSMVHKRPRQDGVYRGGDVVRGRVEGT
jgi:hypothetical protein